MHQGMLVFAQGMVHLPLTMFRCCAGVRRREYRVEEFSCLDQLFAVAFAQLTARESSSDIEVNLREKSEWLYHMDFRRETIAQNTQANANVSRPLQIDADFAHCLIGIA